MKKKSFKLKVASWIAGFDVAELFMLYRKLHEAHKFEKAHNARIEGELTRLKSEVKQHEKQLQPIIAEKQVHHGKIYYVVTQGGYYPCRGYNIVGVGANEVTKRAFKNGFVVNSIDKAEELQRRLRALTRY